MRIQFHGCESRARRCESLPERCESLPEHCETLPERCETLPEDCGSRTWLGESRTELGESRTQLGESQTELRESHPGVRESRTFVCDARLRVRDRRLFIREGRQNARHCRISVCERDGNNLWSSSVICTSRGGFRKELRLLPFAMCLSSGRHEFKYLARATTVPRSDQVSIRMGSFAPLGWRSSLRMGSFPQSTTGPLWRPTSASGDHGLERSVRL